MFNSQNVTATFTRNTDTSKKEIGSGHLDMAGIQIHYRVYASSYKPSGVLVSLPSKALYKDGVPVKNEKGYSVFESLVSVTDETVQTLIDEAVVQGMANKGVFLAQDEANARKAGYDVAEVVGQPKSNNSFSSYSQSNTNTNNTTPPPIQATPKVDNTDTVTNPAFKDNLPF